MNKLACGETTEILDDIGTKETSPTDIKNKFNKKKKNKGGMNFAGKNRAIGGGGWQNHWNSKKDFVRSAILTSRSGPNTANIAKGVFRLLTIIVSGLGTALAKETNGYSLCSYFLKFSR